MKSLSDIIGIDSGLAKKAAVASSVDLFACYQCGKCTNGCPTTFAMDYYPHQIIRMLQLGRIDEILHADSIWVCASCETCFTRCPNEIEIPRLMDYLKQWALSQGIKPAEERVAIFHQEFLNNIKRFGRINEAMLMGGYQLRTGLGGMLKNLLLAGRMLKRGRLAFPAKTGGKAAVKRLFDRKESQVGK